MAWENILTKQYASKAKKQFPQATKGLVVSELYHQFTDVLQTINHKGC